MTNYSSNDITDSGVWTASGSPIVSSDLHGRSNTFDFDQVNDFATHGSATVGLANLNFSVGGWICTPSLAALQVLLAQWETVSGGAWYFSVGTSGELTFLLRNDVVDRRTLSTSSNGVITAGKYSHVLARVRASTTLQCDVALFVNGVECAYASQNSNSASGTFLSPFSSLEPLSIGGRYDTGAANFTLPFLGRIGRPRIWQEDLSDAQIAAEYAAESAAMVGLTSCEDHLYNFDEVSGAIQDSVGATHANTTLVTTYGGDSVTLDGVDDYIQWSAGNSPIRADGNFSGVIILKILNQGVNKPFLKTENDVANQGPDFWWYGATENKFYAPSTSPLGGDSYNDYWNVGKDLSATELVGIAFSYDRATNAWITRFKSDAGGSATRTVTNATADPSWPNRLTLGGQQGTHFLNCQLYYFGVKNGIAYTDAQLLTALNDLIPNRGGLPQTHMLFY